MCDDDGGGFREIFVMKCLRRSLYGDMKILYGDFSYRHEDLVKDKYFLYRYGDKQYHKEKIIFVEMFKTFYHTSRGIIFGDI